MNSFCINELIIVRAIDGLPYKLRCRALHKISDEYHALFKVLFVGSVAGKSSLLAQWCNRPPVFSESYVATIGVDFGVVRVYDAESERTYKLQMWDTR
jgi:GTPase SAR1 family protein